MYVVTGQLCTSVQETNQIKRGQQQQIIMKQQQQWQPMDHHDEN